MNLTDDEVEHLIDAVRYKHSVSEQNDKAYHDEVWEPLLRKLLQELERRSSK